MKRLPILFVIMLIVASCATRERGVAQDVDLQAVKDTDFYFRTEGKMPATPLFTDLIDAYNGFLFLNSLLCDYEAWSRGLAPNAKESAQKIECFYIQDDSVRVAAQRYKNLILSVVSNEALREDTTAFNRVDSAYGEFKYMLIERYHMSNYGYLPEEKYWEIYDKSNVVADYDSVSAMDRQDTLTAVCLKKKIDTELNFDKKCVYTLLYAHTPDADLKLLEDIMLERRYSIYLFETWRSWRCLLQDRYGASKDSNIPNNIYNRARMICATTILKHIMENQNDLMAINQFLILAAQDDIYRYGRFLYGNQNMTEKLELFPELYDY